MLSELVRRQKTGQAELDVWTGQFKLFVEKQVIQSNPVEEESDSISLNSSVIRMIEQSSQLDEVEVKEEPSFLSANHPNTPHP